MLAVSSICLPRQFSCILSSLRLLTSAYRHELSLLFVTYFRSWIADLMDSREIHVHGNPIHLTIYCDSNWSQKHTGENVEIKISFLQFFLRLSLLHCFLRFFRNALTNVKKIVEMHLMKGYFFNEMQICISMPYMKITNISKIYNNVSPVYCVYNIWWLTPFFVENSY